jgi:hypothetical protein
MKMMRRPFRRTRGGVRVQLDQHERALLARLLDDVEGLLAEDAAERGGLPQRSSTPDAGTPDAGTPDAGTPDAGTPDAGTPDAGTPDSRSRDTRNGYPGTADAGDGPGHPGPAAQPWSDEDVLAALEASLTPPPPSDPAVARLLPDGSRDDPEAAAGYRRLTEHTLRERKRAGLGLASAALTRPEPVQLSDAEALALLKGLTDVRLVLAERLGLHTDEDAELLQLVVAAGPSDPRAAAAALYDALTWWQEALVGALH